MAEQDNYLVEEVLKNCKMIVHFHLNWKNIHISIIFPQHNKITIPGKLVIS